MFHHSQILISLVLATIGRTVELERFLESLLNQDYQNFELIIVDQNLDDRLVELIEKYHRDLKIRHLRSTPGLSKARNKALPYVQGGLIGFPDDDCWYASDILSKVIDTFCKNDQADGITGRAGLIKDGNSQWKWDKKSGWVTRNNVFTRGISISIFLSRSVIEKVGLFDETLGLGSGTIWGSGEETDYLIRALGTGNSIWYDTAIFVFHEDTIPDYNSNDRARALSYGAGLGRVLRKNRYSFFISIYLIIRPLMTAIYSLLRCKFKRAFYFIFLFCGRMTGWFCRKITKTQ